MAARGRSRRRRWLIVLAVVAVLAGSATWWAISRLRTDTTPVSFDEAVEEFDERQPSTAPAPTSEPAAATSSSPSEPVTSTATSSGSAPTTSVVEPGVESLPEPGVYRFATAGREQLSILNEPSRTYPDETPIVIEPQGCGVVVRWTPLQERRETWEMCLEDGGVRLAGYTSVHEFFDQREERVLKCEPGLWLIPPPSTPPESIGRCAGSGLTEERTTTVLGRTTVEVGGDEVPAVRIEVAVETSGSTEGRTTRRLTLAAADAFPLVWVDEVANTTATAVGDADYEERLRLEAASLRPE